MSRLQRWLHGRIELQKPPLPGFRGELTIGDLARVEDSTAYLAVLDRWARSTWTAYASLHDVARGWIDHAVEYG